MRRRTTDLLRCPRVGSPLDLQVLDAAGEHVVTGVLSGPAGEYPVVEGIAVLTSAGESVVPQVRARRTAEAAAELAFRDRPRTRWQALASVVADQDRSRALRRVGTRLRARAVRADVAVLADPDPLAPLRRDFLAGRPAMPDAYDYFRYRFALPRHLVAMSVVEATRDSPGPLLDVGCGAGHMTWSLTQLRPGVPVVGVDLSFAQLLVARRLVAPEADLVCADVRSLPFATGAFGVAYAFDVLSFVRDKAVAFRESLRVLGPDGTLVVASLKVAGRPHTYAGMPLPVDGWVALAGDAPVQVLDDAEVVERYLAGQALPEPGQQQPSTGPTVTLVVDKGEARTAYAPWRGWPHARGPLDVNPLYHREDASTLALRAPSPVFAHDNAQLFGYLPQQARLDVTTAVQAAVDGGEGEPDVERLVAELVVLALPPGYREDPWAVPLRATRGR